MCRLSGLPRASRDSHVRRMLDIRYDLDRMGCDEFVWTPYTLPAWRDIELDWVRDEGEVETWKVVVPILLFMFVRFHHADRVKRQLGSEQPVPEDPVNLDGFLTLSARGDDKWWLDELSYWYDILNHRRSIVHQMRVVPTDHGGWPSQQYLQWWERSCRRRYLSVAPVLRDPRGVRLPDSVPPAATQPRDELVLPHDAPVRGRCARQQRPDARRKGKGVASSSRSQNQPGGDTVTEEAERDRHEDVPKGQGVHESGQAAATAHEADPDFFTGADLEMARWAL
ncbi:hypothetical protein PIB30_012619 [Stylosanthes scabra]|uniref:Aminotransferase-like plant mobile domain-containing protein n=1 Tax=Stylosanthes scabra TaxID=79078 RepID=A0ABU6Y811_9FABA|nr:hypothetical protein [Stylosanthes scabra]